MSLKAIEQRLTTLEGRRQPQGEHVPAWYQDMPDDLKADVERMEAIEAAAGGLSADPFVLETSNNLLRFASDWNNQQGVGT